MSLSSRATEKVAEPAPILAELKAALLAKDARVEKLEMENRHLRGRLAAAGLEDLQGRAARAREKGIAQGHQEVETLPTQTGGASPKHNWNVPLMSDSVRLAGPARGVYPDCWAEPRIGIAFVSECPLSTATLNIWFKPIEGQQTANLTIQIDGVDVRHASFELADEGGNLHTIAFPVDIAVRTVFLLSINCDHRAHTEPPERRALCYVIRSIGFA